MNTHLKLYFSVLILAVLAITGFLWWQTVRQSAETSSGLGSEIYQKTGNPAENLPAVDSLGNKPEVNPLSKANPFSNIKTNPFK